MWECRSHRRPRPLAQDLRLSGITVGGAEVGSGVGKRNTLFVHNSVKHKSKNISCIDLVSVFLQRKIFHYKFWKTTNAICPFYQGKEGLKKKKAAQFTCLLISRCRIKPGVFQALVGFLSTLLWKYTT